MGLFLEENHVLTIDPEIKQIPEFKRIVERDKDRNKKKAMAELLFVYFTCDLKSPYYKNTSEAERDSKVAKSLRFDTGWKPDAELIYAQVRYRKEQKTVSTDSLESVREGLFTTNKFINVLRSQLDAALEDPKALLQNPGDIVALTDSVNSLLKLANAVPATINTITALEDKIKQEQSNTKSRLKGGGEKGAYEE